MVSSMQIKITNHSQKVVRGKQQIKVCILLGDGTQCEIGYGMKFVQDEFWCPIENPLKHCHKVVYLTVRPLTLQRQDWAV